MKERVTTAQPSNRGTEERGIEDEKLYQVISEVIGRRGAAPSEIEHRSSASVRKGSEREKKCTNRLLWGQRGATF